MRRYAVETVGSFVLVLTVVTCVLGGAATTPLAVGAVLAAMIYAGGHVSGAHYNPAVTAAAWVRGALPGRDVPGYVVAQVTGAVGGGLVGRAVAGVAPRAVVAPAGARLGAALAAEALLTAALAWVVLHVATSDDHAGNSFYGLAIGGTVLAGATAVGGVSGGAFNPAVTVAAAAAGLFSWGVVLPYVLVQLAAGALAALAYRAVTRRPEARAVPAPRADATGADRVPAPRSAPEPAASPVA